MLGNSAQHVFTTWDEQYVVFPLGKILLCPYNVYTKINPTAKAIEVKNIIQHI